MVGVEQQEQPEDARSVPDLVQAALAEADEHAYWHIVYVLHGRPTREVFEAGRALCASGQPAERELGARILAQLGPGEHPFREEIVPIYTRMLGSEQDVDVLYSVATACGHLKDGRLVEPLVRLRSHPNEDVRYGVVFGLLCQEDEYAIRALIELSADTDEDVRNWALFGLGSMVDIDIPQLREALARGLNDTMDEARSEAILGLARRKDPRAFEPLLRDLWATHAADYTPGLNLAEAAEELADPRLCPALLAHRQAGERDPWLDEAITACCGEHDDPNHP